MAFHKDEAGLSLHALHAFTFATAVERVAGTGYTITAADIGKVAKQTDTNRFYLLVNNSPLTWSEVTAPGGSGGINYVSNDGAEDSAGSWATYADAAAVSPVDGTGGSANITLTRTTSNPLRSNASFLITKDAVNRQGQGVSIDFTIDRADEAKPMSIEFDYEPLSGFVAGSDSTNSDLVVYIYDLDYSTLIQPTPFKLVGGVGSKHKFISEFQSSAASAGVNARKYRLIFHVATTNASAWTFKFDGVRVGPDPLNYGSPITDWQSFTPTGTWNTNTTYTGKFRRVGDNMECLVRLALSGAPNAASLSINLPSGYQIDTSKLNSIVNTVTPFGTGHILDSGVGEYTIVARYFSPTAVALYALNSAASFASENNVSETLPQTFANNDVVEILFSVPILGWSSTVQMSNDASTRIVAASYYVSADTSIPNLTNTYINYNILDKRYDTHSAWDGSKYNIPVSGFYRICVVNRWAPNNAGERVNFVEVNGSSTYEIGGGGQPVTTYHTRTNGEITLNLKAGDYVKFLVEQASGGSLNVTGNSTGTYSYFTIERISGPEQIAASEKIVARYNSNNTDSIPNASDTIINFEDKVIDTHNAVTVGASWKFTAPVSGLYRVASLVESAAGGGWSNGEFWGLRLYKNGSSQSYLGIKYFESTGTSAVAGGSDIIQLNAGDYIDIRVNQQSGATLGTGNNPEVKYVCIEKL